MDDANNVLYGRTDAKKLVGFQRGDVQSVEVFADEANADNIIGLVPVFSDGSGFFSAGPMVESASAN